MMELFSIAKLIEFALSCWKVAKDFFISTDRQLGRVEVTAESEKQVIDDVQKANAAAADPTAIARVRAKYGRP